MNKALAMTAAFAAAAVIPGAASAATNIQIGTNGSWTVKGPGDTLPGAVRVPGPGEIPGVWAASLPGSAWISKDLGGGAAYPDQGNSVPGLFEFSGSFNLSDIGNVQTWKVTWWADNIVRKIIVNGTEIFDDQVGGSLSEQFRAPGISKTFNNPVWVNGNNKVTFVVDNGPGLTGNPAGLRADTFLTAVPEPGTWMLMILGLGAVGFAMRRRQKTSVRLQFA